jgi:hypothetical protein
LPQNKLNKNKTGNKKKRKKIVNLKSNSRSGSGGLLDFDFHGIGVDVALFDGNAYGVAPTGFAVRGVFELDCEFGEHIFLIHNIFFLIKKYT